jgi:DNA-binding NtrC family response regulator
MNSKILVVDDEPDIRSLLQDILEDEGYSVDVAEHAQQASERLRVFAPNLVLLDIWMPEMDGVTLLKQWNDSKEINCPVVMMSGHGTVETAVEATRYGAYDFIEKPLSMAKLLRTVKTALNSSADENAARKAEYGEQPVGNSLIMQNLRQTMQGLSQHLKPVFMYGQAGSGVGIWANYLFGLSKIQVPVQAFHGDMNQYRQGLTHNIYIDEVTDLNMDNQRVLLALLQLPLLPSSRGRLIVGSQYSFETLHSKSEILPELAQYWRRALNIPSLDERIEDIPELLEYYVNWFGEAEGLPYRHFGVAAQNMIRNHQWQDGLNELKTVIRQLLSNSSEDNVDLAEIQQLLMTAHQTAEQSKGEMLAIYIDLNLDMRRARESFERDYLKKQLELCRYNVSELARKIGQERTNLYRKLKLLGLHTKK